MHCGVRYVYDTLSSRITVNRTNGGVSTIFGEHDSIACYCDLHLHSSASDGRLSPSQIVELAKTKGFAAIALTDHDTVAGVEEALQAGTEEGIEVVPGVELSTLYQGGDVHILGYYIDVQASSLREFLAHIIDARVDRARMMVAKLQDIGLDITWGEVGAIVGSSFVGRPHIAQVLLRKGYISSFGEAFTEQYIGKNGKAYVERYEISPEEAIRFIKRYKGIPVLAHPGFFKKDAKLSRTSKGLQGMGCRE